MDHHFVNANVTPDEWAKLHEQLLKIRKPKCRNQITLGENDMIMLVHDIKKFMCCDPVTNIVTYNYPDFLQNNIYTYYGQNKQADYDGDLRDIAAGSRNAFIVTKSGNRVLRVHKVVGCEEMCQRTNTERPVLRLRVTEVNYNMFRSRIARSDGIDFKRLMGFGIEKLLDTCSGIHPVRLLNNRIRQVLGFE
jgi:hypothetical protein